jgi:hypothetical protein
MKISTVVIVELKKFSLCFFLRTFQAKKRIFALDFILYEEHPKFLHHRSY